MLGVDKRLTIALVFADLQKLRCSRGRNRPKVAGQHNVQVKVLAVIQRSTQIRHKHIGSGKIRPAPWSFFRDRLKKTIAMKHQHGRGHMGSGKRHDHLHVHIHDFHRAQNGGGIEQNTAFFHRRHHGVHHAGILRVSGRHTHSHPQNKNPIFFNHRYFFQRSFQGWAFNSSTSALTSSPTWSSVNKTPTAPLPL